MRLLRNFLFLTVLLLVISCTPNPKETANDLINETSPYLLQHAYNPVNWKAWNEQTLAQAKKENKLMIISIGYSACHWCHVMEEESFENDSIAKLMNDNFISIKIDREERTDIDNIYMNAVQLMTGISGWPLNCITLPDGRPIFGGTYFSKDQWEKILMDISKLYSEEPKKAEAYAERVTKGIQNASLVKLNKEEASFMKEYLTTAIQKSKNVLDKNNGGFVGVPKFPMPISIDYLLRYSYQFKDPEIESYLHTTLTNMAYGGIYDQIGGGFSRYSIDDKWHIPHFEKMLYDNAQLVSLYSKAYQLNQNELYKKQVLEILSFIDQELSANEGAFYSSLDADSKNSKGELEEGAYYVWTEAELKTLLKGDYKLFAAYYNINDYGYWKNNHYVLIRNQSEQQFAKKNELELGELKEKVKTWKSILNQARNKRQKPNLDDKVLTSWNALMLQGYVDAYKAFGNSAYLKRAIENADFLIENQLRKDGGLNRNFKNGKSTINAYLEDYATLIQSLISLHEVSLDERYLQLSKNLVDYTVVHFYDNTSSMFFYTSGEDKNLIARKTEVIDGVISSSNSIMANNLFKLGHYLYDTKMIDMSKQMLHNLSSNIYENSLGFANWLHLVTNLTNPFYEIAVVGENAVSVNKELNRYYLPNTIITGSTTDSKQPLLENKYVYEETLIYICVNGTCKLPRLNLVKALQAVKR